MEQKGETVMSTDENDWGSGLRTQTSWIADGTWKNGTKGV